MKKGLLLIVLCLSTMLLSAQDYGFQANPNPATSTSLFVNVQADTVFTTITNTSTNTDDLILNWEIQDIQIPVGWQISICDFNQCHNSGVLSSPAPNFLAFQQSKPLSVLFMDQGVSGIGYVSLRLTSQNSDALNELVTFYFLNLADGNAHPIQGNISFQDDDNCNYNQTNQDLSNWVIKAEGDEDFYAYTDHLGNYWMYVLTGDYDLIAIPPNDRWDVCDNNIPVSLSVFFPDTVVNFVAQKAYECPLLEVDVFTPILRRCFDNRYFIDYCNTGTALATDAYVELLFDEHFTITNSSIPISNQTGNLLRFELGDLNMDTCGRFYIDANLDCNSTILGQTHCVEAHIYPDTTCVPASDLWSGANIEVSARCEGDSIRFKIQNIGTAPSSADLKYKIIEDHVILLQSNFGLNPGDSLISVQATTGKTFRLEAEQEPYFPSKSSPAVAVELCGDNPNQSLGQINLFSLDDEAKFKSIDCRENLGSLAEDGKIAFPKGYGDNHKIQNNTVIEYMIHFQNKGTDTASNVIILDTISEYLNIESIQQVAASHPYSLQIMGNNLLRFSFSNIMLPDSSTNELASHGFIKFKIQQYPANLNPPSFFIENQAAVYFDFNKEVITNTVFHKVGAKETDPPTIITSAPQNGSTGIKVYPNPTVAAAIFELQSKSSKEAIFSLYDLHGRLQRKTRFNHQQYFFQRKELHAGMYIYRIEQAGVLLGVGKLILK